MCFDPGQTTGVALFSLEGKKITLESWFDIHLWDDLGNKIPRGGVVVFENIIPRHLSFNPIGIEAIGVIKYFAKEYGCTLVQQSPVMISGVQKWPIFQWKHVKSPHQRDAISHGIVYAQNNKLELILPSEFMTVSP
jgi:hypothetical protein